MRGHQQLSLFNAHYDERCFLPIHIYDADTGHCVVTILRPGKTPDGREVRAHIRRLVRRIRMHWPKTLITIRGDSHYGRRQAMDWCEQNGVRYIFGLAPNKTLAALIFAKLDECCVRRAQSKPDARGKPAAIFIGHRVHVSAAKALIRAGLSQAWPVLPFLGSVKA